MYVHIFSKHARKLKKFILFLNAIYEPIIDFLCNFLFCFAMPLYSVFGLYIPEYEIVIVNNSGKEFKNTYFVPHKQRTCRD